MTGIWSTPILESVPIIGPLPVDPLVLVAFALLALGVVFSIVPVFPGPPLSVGGVLLYWWATGDPGVLLLGALLIVGVGAILVDWLGGIVAARASGVSTRVSVLATAVGLAGTFVLGPPGLLVGIAGTVFLATYRVDQDTDESLRAAAYATAGVLGSAAVQALLTGSVLVTVALIHVL